MMKFLLSSLFAISIFIGCAPEQKVRMEGEKPEVSEGTEQAAKPDFGSAKP